MTTAAKVIAHARGDLGMRESPPGSNLVPITREFGRIPGYPGGGYGYPWCAAATSVWCKRAGLAPGKDYPHTASTIAQYDWAKANGRWHTTPKPGDLVLYSTNGTSGGIYHVELVEAVSAGSITTIGGNTSGSAGAIQGNGNGCYRKTVSRGNRRIFGYVRPRYRDAAADDRPWDGRSYPGRLIRRGDRGPEVKAVQRMLTASGLKLDVDGHFGPATEEAVRAFQKSRMLEVDGVVGPDTWKALAAVAAERATAAAQPGPRVLQAGDAGDDVRAVRDRLIELGYSYLTAGDRWDPLTTTAVTDFQARHELTVDGRVGPQTLGALGLPVPEPHQEEAPERAEARPVAR